MKKLLMFDDFLINRSDNTHRRFHQPAWQLAEPFADAAAPQGTQGMSIVPAPDGGYLMSYILIPDLPAAQIDDALLTGLARSDDGITFRPDKRANPGYPAGSHILGRYADPLPSFVYHDQSAADPAQRYKAICIPYGKGATGPVESPPYLLTSGDARHWAELPGSPLVPSYVDCAVSLLHNPVTGRYQATTRRRWGERRICLVESDDLQTWTTPRAILHPLPTDEPTTHYYGMPHTYYKSGDLFIGFLWKQVMPFDRIMDGPMSTEYVYSYDGLTWNRTWAEVFTRGEYGQYGGGGCFVFSMIEQGDRIIFHANVYRYEHGGLPQDGRAPAGQPGRTIVAGQLARDRMVGIESGKGQAEMVTQNLLLHAPELRLNVLAPFASVRAQISRHGQPVAGFTYEDCQPIGGDHLDIPLRWQGGSLEQFCGGDQWIKLHLRFNQAEIFGLAGDFAFTVNPKAPICDWL